MLHRIVLYQNHVIIMSPLGMKLFFLERAVYHVYDLRHNSAGRRQTFLSIQYLSHASMGDLYILL